MDYRQLGDSGPVVSRIAYGNSLTHANQVDDATARACVRTALDAGVTFFDTADVYAAGRAEEVLGRSLTGVPRDGLVLSTKVFFPTGPGPDDRGLSRAHVLAAADASLRRLGTDRIDLYQAHRFDPDVALEETMDAFGDLVRAGKVRHVGVSDWTPDQLRRGAAAARAAGVPLVSNQLQYSLLARSPEDGLLAACADLGLGPIAWSPLAGGVLTGKYRPDVPPPADSRVRAADGGGRLLDRHGYLGDDVLRRVRRAGELAAAAGLPTAVLALAWVLRSGVCATIVGASRPEQLAGNLAALDTALDPDLVTRVEEILAAA